MTVIILPPAADEAAAAMAFYEAVRPELGQAFESELEAALDLIESAPHAWPRLIRRHRFVLLRRFPYKIVFRTSGDQVLVVAIAHTSRRPGYWRNR